MANHPWLEVGKLVNVDSTITVGNMVEIGLLLVGGIITFTQIKSRQEVLRETVKDIRTEVKHLGEAFREYADLATRVRRNEEDIRELRHGRGFVRGGHGIDHEYGSR